MKLLMTHFIEKKNTRPIRRSIWKKWNFYVQFQHFGLHKACISHHYISAAKHTDYSSQNIWEKRLISMKSSAIYLERGEGMADAPECGMWMDRRESTPLFSFYSLPAGS
jgi:hypothetical protein